MISLCTDWSPRTKKFVCLYDVLADAALVCSSSNGFLSGCLPSQAVCRCKQMNYLVFTDHHPWWQFVTCDNWQWLMMTMVTTAYLLIGFLDEEKFKPMLLDFKRQFCRLSILLSLANSSSVGRFSSFMTFLNCPLGMGFSFSLMGCSSVVTSWVEVLLLFRTWNYYN